MSKSLKSMSTSDRTAAIHRRIKAVVKRNGERDEQRVGLGFLAAIDAKNGTWARKEKNELHQEEGIRTSKQSSSSGTVEDSTQDQQE